MKLTDILAKTKYCQGHDHKVSFNNIHICTYQEYHVSCPYKRNNMCKKNYENPVPEIVILRKIYK